MKRLTSLSSRLNLIEVPEGLDLDFYRSFNPDLSKLSKRELVRHWLDYGRDEGRYPNLSSFLRNCKDTVAHVLPRFDWRVYLALYPDLAQHGLKDKSHALVHFLKYGLSEGRSGEFNEDFYSGFYGDLAQFAGNREAAIHHWLKYGKNEGRSPTLGHYVSRFKLHASFVTEEMEWGKCEVKTNHVTPTTRPAFLDVPDRWQFLARVFSQEPPWTPPVLGNRTQDVVFYQELAVAYVRAGNDGKAREIYLGILNDCAAVAHEALGDLATRAGWRDSNHIQRERQMARALAHYQFAKEANPESVVATIGISRSLAELGRHEESVTVAQAALNANQDSTPAEEQVMVAVTEYWEREWADADVLASVGGRQAVYQLASKLARRIEPAFTQVVTHGGDMCVTPSLNTGKVLIVGNMDLPQCRRYRIEQKLEQIEAAGYAGKVVPWTSAKATLLKELAFHDIVIFYRLPAVPSVVRLMSTARALGKVTIFEIDDFLFDPMFPPPIETYGGQVSNSLYLELIKGGALLRAAAELCDYGIASTRGLVEQLQSIVRTGRCYLHRNGLDRHMPNATVDVADETNGINIFYGSGTLAHNSDFIEETLPAVEQVLRACPQTRLTIAGYLTLPDDAVKRMGSRLTQIPLKDVEGYYQELMKSHINLAVLKSDPVTDCKSELKWFEAGVVGIPAVVGPTANYLDVIRDGVDGVIAFNSEDWRRALMALVSDPQLRKRIGLEAQRRVLTEYSVKTMGQNLRAILGAAIDHFKSGDASVVGDRYAA